MVIPCTLIAWDILTARQEVANNGHIPPSLNYGPLLEWDVTVDTHAHTHTRKSHTLVLVSVVRYLLASKCVRIGIRCFFMNKDWPSDTLIDTDSLTQWRCHTFNDTYWLPQRHWHNGAATMTLTDTMTPSHIMTFTPTHTHTISLTQQHSQVNKPTNKSQIKSFPE